MAFLPKTVGELRQFLETYPDELNIMVQGDTVENPNATPNRFVVEFWDEPNTTDYVPFLLLAGIPYKEETPDNVVSIYTYMDPNASWNLPK